MCYLIEFEQLLKQYQMERVGGGGGQGYPKLLKCFLLDRLYAWLRIESVLVQRGAGAMWQLANHGLCHMLERTPRCLPPRIVALQRELQSRKLPEILTLHLADAPAVEPCNHELTGFRGLR